MKDNPNTEGFETALGNLINACSTVQSVVLGGSGGIERERALASFDRSLEEAAQARRECFGDPRETAANPAVNPDDPIVDLESTSMDSHSFDTRGKT